MKAVEIERKGRLGRIIQSFGALSSAAGILAGIFLFSLTLLVFVSVIARYVFNSPLIITEDVASFLMVGIVFAGLGYTLKMGGHIRVNILRNRFPKRLMAVLDPILVIIAIFYCALLLMATVKLNINYVTGPITSITLRVPMIIPGIIMPIGLSILLLQFIATFRERIR